MFFLKRSEENPILIPKLENAWEAEAVFNGCPVVDNKKIHFVYRAVSAPQLIEGAQISLSTIGYAESPDGIHFKNRKQLIKPEYDWEKYGCEDPRVTKFNGRYFIFYTALSAYPFRAEGIKIGLAITKDFKKIDAKFPITPFNAKAMALFPERINSKIAAILTADTDNPPAKIGLAFFDNEEQIWSQSYWEKWYSELGANLLNLRRFHTDQIEVGAPPIKTKDGWLVIYSYIQNYFSPPANFTIEAVLLDLKNPLKIISRTKTPLLTPLEEYEKYGRVPYIVFPSGALLRGQKIFMYYGAADTTCALATFSTSKLINELTQIKNKVVSFEKYKDNPIIKPIADHAWESKATFNPGVIYLDKKIYLIYRAMSDDNTSVLGQASTRDGFKIDERLPEPIYSVREPFEQKIIPGANSGCEDPRLTQINDTIYMCYTAFDGKNFTRVALSSIPVKDFLVKKWNWAKPVLISPPNIHDKDAAIFPKKIKGKYAILHRLNVDIWIDFVDNLEFDGEKFIKGQILMSPRFPFGKGHSKKIGIAGPPLETERGWLLLYHGISQRPDNHYHLRAALLDLYDPTKIIARTDETILEPELSYEEKGVVPNVVFSCGNIILNDTLYVYYGAADTVIGVATLKVSDLLKKLLSEKIL